MEVVIPSGVRSGQASMNNPRKETVMSRNPFWSQVRSGVYCNPGPDIISRRNPFWSQVRSGELRQ